MMSDAERRAYWRRRERQRSALACGCVLLVLGLLAALAWMP